MLAKCFKMECLTNMHVGNGDVNFSVVDKEVERDPVTDFPTVNASGLKGALREFFESGSWQYTEAAFGSPANKTEESNQGKLKILSANLLALPMRATDGKKAYYLVSNKDIVNEFNTLCSAMNIKLTLSEKSNRTKVSVEDVSCELTDGFEPVKLENVAVMATGDFKGIPLPVIARNCLEENNRNLWYEEIVPHKSVFYFFAVCNDADKSLLTEFSKAICATPVQVGANASIGYGLCKISELGGACNE